MIKLSEDIQYLANELFNITSEVDSLQNGVWSGRAVRDIDGILLSLDQVTKTLELIKDRLEDSP